MSTPLLVALSIVLLGLPSPTNAAATQAGGDFTRCEAAVDSVQGAAIRPVCPYELRETNHVLGIREHAGAGPQYASTLQVAEHSSWTMSVSRDPDRVSLDGPADDGIASLSGGCNRLLGPGLWATIHNYRGKMLKRIDDESEDVFFKIDSGRDGMQPFAGQMRYVAFEKAWVTTTPLPTAFIIALSRGDSLVLTNAKETRVLSFNLKGIAPIVKTMRDVCGF